MSELRIDASVPGLDEDTAGLAEAAEAAGFDGIWAPEMDFDAFLPLPVVAEHTTDIELGTRIATAFARSPMVLALQGWDLQRYSDGRFVLGLGTQVKGHNERRFSVDFEWERPGPRLREVVESIKHIWDVFEGEADEFDYDGEFYQFSLLPEAFDPGPLDSGQPDIWVAGVNEYNLKMAGGTADGLCMHIFNTPEYTEEVIEPTVRAGAEKMGKSMDEVTLSASPFVITGDADRRAARREEVRGRIAFYGSTRTYHDVFELHGWDDIGPELHELSKEGQWGEMQRLVTDEMVEAFAVEAPPEELADEIRETYGGIADRVQLEFDPTEPFWEDVVGAL
ncbi:TIGR03617 family F420-dependent LLM class oxidoreductase [Haloglomus litoreum]|uniref:TIGR03617 family F420-dependent LLM class oxidoreductase n=1 Tax=Haloglomus litoreum TaxID=3034026 RepID=UPI0023E8AA0C|nr:TIGR03617 family F420-dependent LLM class oxidoreductase [Haloglomus sp. DT116]